MKKFISPGILDTIRSTSRKVILEKFPEETEIFNTVWEAMKDRLHGIERIAPEDTERLKNDLNFMDEADVMDLATPKVIALINLTVLKSISLGGKIQTAGIEKIIRKYGDGLPGPIKVKAIDFLVPLIEQDLKKIRESLGEDVAEEEKEYVMYSHSGREELSESQYLTKRKTDNKDYAIWLDEVSNSLYVFGKYMGMDPVQRKVLKLLIKEAGKVVKYKDIFEEIGSIPKDDSFPYDKDVEWDSSYNYLIFRWVSDLHKNTNSRLKDFVVNIRGGGYKLDIETKNTRFSLIGYLD